MISKYYKSNTSIQGPGSNKSDADFNLYLVDFPNYNQQSNYLSKLAFFSENIFYLSSKLSFTPGKDLNSLKLFIW